MTESELVELCRKGNREAQRCLYAQTSERVYQLLLRMTRNADTALDLAQQTYLRAFTRIGQFDGRSSVATWLYRIAVTEALQFLRREKRIRIDRNTDDSRATAESPSHQSDLKLDLAEALTTLDPTDRSMLLLRYHQGLDYRTIAETVGCPLGTVASRLNRARLHLRNRLKKSYASGEENESGRHQMIRRQSPGTLGPRPLQAPGGSGQVEPEEPSHGL